MRTYAPADEKQPTWCRNLNAADRNARDVADVGDRPEAVESARRLLPGDLPRQPEDRSVRGELHLVIRSAIDAVQLRSLLRERRPEAEARHQLLRRFGERLADRREIATTVDVDVAVSIHESLQQGQPLIDRRSEVMLRDVLVAQQTHRAQNARQGLVPNVPTRAETPRVTRASDPVDEWTGSLRRNEVPGPLDLVEDFLVGAGDLRLRAGAITEPGSEHIRIDVQIVALGILRRRRQRDLMVPLAAHYQ